MVLTATPISPPPMADTQRVQHRKPHEVAVEGIQDIELSQNPDEKGSFRSTESNDTINGINPGDPFPEDPLIPTEEHTFTVYGCPHFFLAIKARS